jgi:hypothetical protein
MKFIIEVRYDPPAADAVYTLLEQKFPQVIRGSSSSGGAEGFTVEGSWVALETGSAFIAIEAKDGLPVYKFCREVTNSADGVKVHAVAVMPVEELKKVPG